MRKQFVINKYIPSYFEELSELGFLFLKLHKDISIDIQSFKKEWKPYINEICGDDKKIIAVALKKNNKKIIGYAIAQFNENKNSEFNSIILNELYIDEHFRNKGIGRMLLNEIFAWGKKVGANEIILKVRAKNQTAVAFYKKMNFSIYNYILKRRL